MSHLQRRGCAGSGIRSRRHGGLPMTSVMQCRVTKGKFVDRVSIRAMSCEKPGSSSRDRGSAIVWNFTDMIGEVTRDQVAAFGPTAALLYDDWYPALRSSEVGGKRMAK